MKVQNGWEIYKSKHIDWIGVGRNQNVRDLKRNELKRCENSSQNLGC